MFCSLVLIRTNCPHFPNSYKNAKKNFMGGGCPLLTTTTKTISIIWKICVLFSVAKATLEVQMSVCLSVRPSVTKTPKQHKINHYTLPQPSPSYTPPHTQSPTPTQHHTQYHAHHHTHHHSQQFIHLLHQHPTTIIIF